MEEGDLIDSRLSQLQEWERDLLAEQEAVARQLEPLLARREAVRAKLELVQRLKGLEGDGDDRHGVPSKNHTPGAPATAGAELQAMVREVLEAHGKPMHVQEIRAALTERGVPIPGKGTDANIIVHLRRAPELFSRSGRGVYGLKTQKPRRNGGV
jgi:hypothetical protein